MEPEGARISRALTIARQHGTIDGAHHKMWVIDQMVRALCGNNASYEKLVAEIKAGSDGPETYEWDTGVAP